MDHGHPDIIGHHQAGVEEECEAGTSPETTEAPLDYSMTRKRRILNSYDEESPLNKVKKTLDYGSDGHSEGRSCSGSPVQSSLTSSPEVEPADQVVRRLHPLPDLPFHNIHQQQQNQHNAAALQFFLQVQQHHHQQQQQHQTDLHNRLVSHHFQPPVAWLGSPSPPATPSSSSLTATGTPNGLTLSASTPSSSLSSSQTKDSAYWERRRKNNEAAKRSRDARRAKEQQVAIRAQLLEQENIRLKFEIAQLRAENNQMRDQFFLLRAAGKE